MTVPPRTIDDGEIPDQVEQALPRGDKVLAAFLSSAAVTSSGTDLTVTLSTGFNLLECLVVATGLSLIAAEAYGRDDDCVEFARSIRDVANMLGVLCARIHKASQDTLAGGLH